MTVINSDQKDLMFLGLSPVNKSNKLIEKVQLEKQYHLKRVHENITTQQAQAK